jgi:GT2 family glycosyltransferase
MSDKFYILLPVHNRREITRSFVQCLQVQSHPGYHLVLIDDGSTDGTADMVRESIHSLTVLHGKGDLWWAGSLQKGLDWLTERETDDSAIVLFINNDVTFGPDYLSSACSVMKNRSGLLLLSRYSSDGGNVISESGVIADLKRMSFRAANAGEEINCLSTRGLFIRFGDIRIIGDFHTRVLPHYLSDYEYTIRAARKGMRCETSERVFLCPNHDTTGYHEFKEPGFLRFLKRYFSIKSVLNPIYLSVFAILSAPKPWILPNLARIWFRCAKIISRQTFISVKALLDRDR